MKNVGEVKLLFLEITFLFAVYSNFQSHFHKRNFGQRFYLNKIGLQLRVEFEGKAQMIPGDYKLTFDLMCVAF